VLVHQITHQLEQALELHQTILPPQGQAHQITHQPEQVPAYQINLLSQEQAQARQTNHRLPAQEQLRIVLPSELVLHFRTDLQLQALEQLQMQELEPQKRGQALEPNRTNLPTLEQERLQREAQVLQQVAQMLMAQEQVHQIIHLLEQEQDFQTNLPPALLPVVQTQELAEEPRRNLQTLQLRALQGQPFLSFLCYQQHNLPNEVPRTICVQIVAFPL